MSKKERGDREPNYRNGLSTTSGPALSNRQSGHKSVKEVILNSTNDFIHTLSQRHKKFADSDSDIGETKDGRSERGHEHRSSTSIQTSRTTDRKPSVHDSHRTDRDHHRGGKSGSLNNDDRSTGKYTKDPPLRLTTSNQPSPKKQASIGKSESHDITNLIKGSYNNGGKSAFPTSKLLRPHSSQSSPTKHPTKATPIDMPSDQPYHSHHNSQSPSRNHTYHRSTTKSGPHYKSENDYRRDHKPLQSPTSRHLSKYDDKNEKSHVPQERKDVEDLHRHRKIALKKNPESGSRSGSGSGLGSGSGSDADSEGVSLVKSPPIGYRTPSKSTPIATLPLNPAKTTASSYDSKKAISGSNTPPQNKQLISKAGVVPDEIDSFGSDSESNDFQTHGMRENNLKTGNSPKVEKERKYEAQERKPNEAKKSKPLVVTDSTRSKFSDIMPKATQFGDKTKTTSSSNKSKPDYFDLGSRVQSRTVPKSSYPDKIYDHTSKSSQKEKSMATNTPSAKRAISPQFESDSDLEEPDFMKTTIQVNDKKEPDLDHSDIDAISALTPSSMSKFQTPSPSKKRRVLIDYNSSMDTILDNDLEDSGLMDIFDNKDACPYCGDRLPEKKSPRLSSALAKILGRKENPGGEAQQPQQQEQQKEHDTDVIDLSQDYSTSQQTDNDDISIIENPFIVKKQPRPRRKKTKDVINLIDEIKSEQNEEPEESTPLATSSNRVPLLERFEFCRIHVAEEKIVPMGIERGYPTVIDFSKLEERVNRFIHELIGIISKKIPSVFLDMALKRYRNMGTLGARRSHVVLANVGNTIPGYYGTKGSAELLRILAKLFLESKLLTHEHSDPQLPIEYIQEVLVPEAGLRLIAEDRNLLNQNEDEGQSKKVSLEEAREIMHESTEFGSYMHDVLET